MTNSDLEPRPLYGIGTVARLTGLKPDTLRVWERRYGLGASHKSASGRRQYTQNDLDHLQLIAELVRGGARIGEIANAERKTLEILQRQQSGKPHQRFTERASVLFVGIALCAWLDEHQGLLSNVDASLARRTLEDFNDAQLERLKACDVVVVEAPSLSSTVLTQLDTLRESVSGKRMVVCYRFGNDHWLRELEERGVTAIDLPPDPGRLAFELARGAAIQQAQVGEQNLGDLVAARPRQFAERELAAARTLRGEFECECPRHVADLVNALNSFEDYSSSCSADNWHDAALHACIYAYAGQARHLMEKALHSILEERSEEFRAAVQRERSAGVGHVA